MVLRAEAIQSPGDPIEGVSDVVPLIVPMAMWEILVIQGEFENCSPGEVLDKALSNYLEENGGERAQAIKAELEKRQSVAHSGGSR